MANDVFANGREISCKKADGKSICAFPDVCMTPPENPATPPGVPVPYPNTGLARDTTDGSRSVKISGKEIMLKNKSYFKKSIGDEAGCAAKKGVVTSVNRGKVYFIAWSMDVKYEGENVVRHLDMTTHNHASPVANESIPWPYADGSAMKGDDPCKREKDNEQEACKDFKPQGKKNVCRHARLNRKTMRSKGARRVLQYLWRVLSKERMGQAMTAAEKSRAAANKCITARSCRLVPYDAPKDGINGCCSSQTGHHVVPKSYCKGKGNYDIDKAPTMCVLGSSQYSGNHMYMHASQASKDRKYKPLTLRQASKNAAQSVQRVFPGACSKKCIEAQLINGHQKMQVPPNTHMEYDQIVGKKPETLAKYLEKMREDLARAR